MNPSVLDTYSQILPDWLKHPDLIDASTIVEYPTGEPIFDQGDEPDSVYVILDGTVSVHRTEASGKVIELDRLSSGAVVGEMGLLSRQPRSATITTLTPSRLMRVTAEAVLAIQLEDDSIGSQLMEGSIDRWQRIQLSSILAKIFGELDVETLHDLQNRFIWRHLGGGDILCRQNDQAQSMFLIVSGRLRFDVMGEFGEQKTVGEAGPGETVGEFALITDSTRSATVTAVRETVVVELTQSLYMTLVQTYPELVPAITRIIVERRQRSIGHLKSDNDTQKLALTVLSIDPHIDIDPFIDQLNQALNRYGSTQLISASRIDQALNRKKIAQVERNDPFNTSVVQWLSEQEAKTDILIYKPDSTWSVWTQRCISQSDRILLVGRPNVTDATGQSEVEKAIGSLKLSPRQELVLWHPPTTDFPSNTVQWLNPRPQINRHHHIKEGDTSHFLRLARSLTGNSIGLVLSGGGAKGFSHVGVSKSIDELDIPIDYVGGTSFGSIVSALIAVGHDFDEMIELAKQFSSTKVIMDRTFPMVALNKSAGIVRVLKTAFGNLQIEDTWIPFFAVTTNLVTAEAEVVLRGDIWLAIRKSISIPGVFSPILEDGNVYVDGGVMNNLPIDSMAELLDSQRIIAVTNSGIEAKSRYYDLGHSVSGWRLLLNRLNPFSKNIRIPSIGYTLMRTMDINSVHLIRRNMHLVDLMVVIRAKEFGFTEYGSYAEIAEDGYVNSIEVLANWKEKQTDL